MSTSLRHDEPSLEIRYAVGAAAFGVAADGQLGETDRTSCPIIGEQNSDRLVRLTSKEPLDLLVVLGLGALGPEGLTQLKPRSGVARLRGSNGNRKRLPPNGWRVSCGAKLN